MASLDLPEKILGPDELWSFVLKTTQQAWTWIALCVITTQVVAFAVGDRSEITCQRPWETAPQAYKSAHCYSDFWRAYQAVLPQKNIGRWVKKAAKRITLNAGIIYLDGDLFNLSEKRSIFPSTP